MRRSEEAVTLNPNANATVTRMLIRGGFLRKCRVDDIHIAAHTQTPTTSTGMAGTMSTQSPFCAKSSAPNTTVLDVRTDVGVVVFVLIKLVVDVSDVDKITNVGVSDGCIVGSNV